MNEQVLTTIITSFGAPGAVLVVCLYALRALKAEVSAVQTARIADAQVITAKLLELVQQQHEHTTVLAKAIDGNSDAVHDVRMLIESTMIERSINVRPVPPVPVSRR